jgi:alpha-1,2-mannosyltransferase
MVALGHSARARGGWFSGGLLGLLAAAICVVHLVRGHALLGLVEYDDGVYVGGALRSVRGVMPYRDFAFGHPPGILLLLLPLAIASFSFSTRPLMGAARAQTALVTGANVFFLARLVKHRGTGTVLLCGVLLAVYPPAVFADKTAMLEPYLVLFCLLGAALMFDGDDLASPRRLTCAGVALGFAGAVKIWAVLPALVSLLCCLPRGRQTRSLALGLVAGFAIPSLPFFLLAPSNFIRDVLVVQLERGGAYNPSLTTRLYYIAGTEGHAGLILAASLAVLYALLVATAFLISPRPSRLDWFALGAATSSVAALLAARTFYFHYAYFSAPFLALLLALSADRLVRRTRLRATAGTQRRRTLASVRVLGFAMLTLIALFAAGLDTRHFNSYQDPGSRIAAIIPAGACVVADQPAMTIIANRFISNQPQCPTVVDPFLVSMISNPTDYYVPGHLFRLVSEWRAWISEADYLAFADPSKARLAGKRWLRRRFRKISASPAIYIRRR